MDSTDSLREDLAKDAATLRHISSLCRDTRLGHVPRESFAEQMYAALGRLSVARDAFFNELDSAFDGQQSDRRQSLIPLEVRDARD